MRNLFINPKTNKGQKQYMLNLEIQKINQLSLGTKEMYIQDHKVWNSLPFHTKYTKKIFKFSKTQLSGVAIFVLILDAS